MVELVIIIITAIIGFFGNLRIVLNNNKDKIYYYNFKNSEKDYAMEQIPAFLAFIKFCKLY